MNNEIKNMDEVTKVVKWYDEPLVKDMKGVLITVSVATLGYFFTEVGKGFLKVLTRNEATSAEDTSK